VHFPQGYGVIYAGAYAEQQSSFKDLLMILILASLLVILVLLVLFRNIRLTLIIIFISIISIGGAIIALFLTGIPLNVGSYTGIIMIVGIIAENAVFTSQQFLLTLKVTNNCDLAINFAIAVRLRPKLMTALSAIIALTPLALGGGTGAQMHQPLAIAVIGVFICGLPMLLIVFPSILRMVYAKNSKES
jgi:heavy metal efflux system protein